MDKKRREFALTVTTYVVGCLSGSTHIADNWHRALRRAGDTSDPFRQYELLVKLRNADTLPEAEQEYLEILVHFIDQWLHGKAKYADRYTGSGLSDAYLCGFFSGKSTPEKWLLPKVPPSSLFFPLIGFFRAKVLIAEMIEKGEISKVPETRARYMTEATNLLRQSVRAFPENQLMAMYHGEPIPWDMQLKVRGKAPEWAVQQRETLTKLRDIAIWWVNHRQLENGQFGGGWGDDVEMWRDFTPLILAFSEPDVIRGQTRLSEGLFATERIKDGYSNKITDVEHTAEDTADSITAMMHITPEDPLWVSRAKKLVDLMKNKWTGINERGFLQFKSTYFTANEVDPDPRKACDSVYHPRTIQPALLYWQRTGDKEIGDLVTSWMDTWVDAASRSSNGKPAGILPSAIHWPDGEAGGTTDTWWDPGNHTDDPLYVWPSAMGMMLNTLLLTWYQTGNDRYLNPMKSMAGHMRDHLDNENQTSAPGSLAWCSEKMTSFLPDILAKYRVLSNDEKYDDLIEAHASDYARFRLFGDRHSLLNGIASQRKTFTHNEIAFKEEVRWTDRLFRFHPTYFNTVSQHQFPEFDPGFMLECVSGSIGNVLYFPTHAVKWQTSAEDLAVLVKNCSKSGLSAEMYHFGADSRTVGAQFFLLQPGKYSMSISTDKEVVSHLTMEQKSGTQTHFFQIPPRVLTFLTITRI